MELENKGLGFTCLLIFVRHFDYIFHNDFHHMLEFQLDLKKITFSFFFSSFFKLFIHSMWAYIRNKKWILYAIVTLIWGYDRLVTNLGFYVYRIIMKDHYNSQLCPLLFMCFVLKGPNLILSYFNIMRKKLNKCIYFFTVPRW